MTLYEIDSEIVSINEKIEQYAMDNDGLIPPDLDEMLENLQMDREKKIGNIARFLKNVKSDVEAVENEIAILTAKKKALTNKVESVRKFLAFAVGEGVKFKDAVSSIFWKSSESVIVEDPELLPVEFQKVTIEAKKAEIKAAINSGVTVAGAAIKPSISMVVR